MSEPTIPFNFDPPSDEFEEHHLIYKDVPGGKAVTWPAVGTTIIVPSATDYPEFSDIEKANGGLVRFYGLTGFSVGNYHEFLIGELPGHTAYRMGGVEVSFGGASPLMACLFDGYHREKYFGLWESITTVRILGAHHDDAEIIFLNAAILYKEAHGILPLIFAMDHSFLDYDEPDQPQAAVLGQEPAIRDIEPIRFFYHGESQSDDAAACIYFYRVMEYYSFLTNKRQMTTLRHNSSLSEDEFAKQILQLVSRDDKGPFLKLVNAISDDVVLKQAVAFGLIKDASAAVLGDAIYAFRNSIVHGKTSHGYSLQSSSVFFEEGTLPAWRVTLQGMARRSMKNFGSRLL